MNSKTVDLIATDPPFNKGRDFHATPDSLAKGGSFQDRWSWDKDVDEKWVDQLKDDWPHLYHVIDGSRQSYGDDMGAFLCFMGVRLLEMKRVLKNTGSIYLHCDPTASHYLKELMDAVFGRDNFRNEIVWKKIRVKKSQSDGFGNVHDIILAYRKTSRGTFNHQYVPHSAKYIKSHWSQTDENGRRYRLVALDQKGAGPPRYFNGKPIEPPEGKHWVWTQEKIDQGLKDGIIVFSKNGRPRIKKYLDEMKGDIVTDMWDDIIPLNSMSNERTGYPTQKPLELYERIIKASSNESDIVLDPFCGCATTCVAAEKLRRQWVGIDIWNKAHQTVINRLKNECHLAGPEGDRADLLIKSGDITYAKKPMKRTDDGRIAVPFLKTKEKTIPLEPPGVKMTRDEMYAHLLAKNGLKCQGCDREFDHLRYLELDHNTPRADGGINHISNRILLCSPCNRLKSHTLTLSGLRRENKKQKLMANQESPPMPKPLPRQWQSTL